MKLGPMVYFPASEIIIQVQPNSTKYEKVKEQESLEIDSLINLSFNYEFIKFIRKLKVEKLNIF